MKYLKSFEDIACVNAGTAGMGSVVNSQPGYLPGTAGISGSGDVSFPLLSNGKKKRRRKLGNPSEVSDARFLAPVKTNKVTEGIIDRVEDLFISKNDDNEFARRLLSKLDDIDPEDIQKNNNEYSFILNKNKMSIDYESGFMANSGYYILKADENHVKSS